MKPPETSEGKIFFALLEGMKHVSEGEHYNQSMEPFLPKNSKHYDRVCHHHCLLHQYKRELVELADLVELVDLVNSRHRVVTLQNAAFPVTMNQAPMVVNGAYLHLCLRPVREMPTVSMALLMFTC